MMVAALHVLHIPGAAGSSIGLWICFVVCTATARLPPRCYLSVHVSAGSDSMWVASSLLLQLRVPNDMLGQIVALEAALYTLTEAGGAVWAGAALDLLQLSVRQVLLSLAGVAGAAVAGWAAFATAWRRHWGRDGELVSVQLPAAEAAVLLQLYRG